MKITLRLAVPEDAASIADLIHQMGYPVSVSEAVDRIKKYSQPYYRLILAEQGGETVGLIALHIYEVLHLPAPEGRVISFCVDEKIRGNGVGTTLLKEAENFFKESGCYKIVLNCNLRRTDTHLYYENRGYQFTSKHFAKFFMKSENSQR
jgi:predicted N-acetyltransferase YhbS